LIRIHVGLALVLVYLTPPWAKQTILDKGVKALVHRNIVQKPRTLCYCLFALVLFIRNGWNVPERKQILVFPLFNSHV